MDEEIIELIKLVGATKDEVIKALLSAFCPLDPGARRGVWRQSSKYGNSAPSTEIIWDVYKKAEFKCVECGSHRRLTIDHIDENPTNHAVENLRLLCFDCNREKACKGEKNKDHRLRIYRSMLKLYKQTGHFPTKKEILLDAGIINLSNNSLSGAIYMVKYFEILFNLQSISICDKIEIV